ncbi:MULTISPECIES: dethiobiotin synthase [unclassified Saccharothrix]|uniref:dethiobiotin synthase n=1 Tax=unclassified Saccharothrix TaxID=2593673 RepID=UPI00307E2D5E
MSVLVITGTGTEVGKTVTVAALAALAVADGRRVAVLKPAQTGVADGEPGDLADVVRLAGPVTTLELRRYPEPLAPATAARRSGLPRVHPSEVAAAAVELDETHDLVLVEGAGGLLVQFDDEGTTIADAAWALNAPVLVVAHAALGTLNTTALTAEALLRRGLESVGVVIGRWPAEPDLAARCNLVDLPEAAGAPLLGVLPDGAGGLGRDEFLTVAREGLSPWFGGTFDPEKFAAPHVC